MKVLSSCDFRWGRSGRERARCAGALHPAPWVCKAGLWSSTGRGRAMPDASGKPATSTSGGAIAEIEAVVRTYFDGLYEGDVEKLGTAFHPVSHLYSERDGEVVDLPREQWFEMVRSRPKPAA